jgi:hypothetical protein
MLQYCYQCEAVGYCTKACREADRDRHLRECLPVRSMSLVDTRMPHNANPGPAAIRKEVCEDKTDLPAPEQAQQEDKTQGPQPKRQENKTQDPRIARRNAKAGAAPTVINGDGRESPPDDDQEATATKDKNQIPVWALPVPRDPAGANRQSDSDEEETTNRQPDQVPPWEGPTTVPKNPIKRRKPSILDNNNATALEVMVADPFRRLRDGQWLLTRTKKDVDQLLIDSYRYRRYFEKQHGVHVRSSLQSYLDRAQTVSLLPKGFNLEEQKLLIERAKSMKTDMIDTETVESTYNDVQMPLQMRLFADQVVGNAVTPEMKVGQDVWVDIIKWEDWAWAGFEWTDNFAGRF